MLYILISYYYRYNIVNILNILIHIKDKLFNIVFNYYILFYLKSLYLERLY